MDYSKCVIYKIVCNDESVTECYVGHTTNFVRRKYCHKTNCNIPKMKQYNVKLYQIIRKHGGWNNFNMLPICEYPCENYIQACIKEEEYRIKLLASLNNNKCYADSKTKDYQKEYQVEYHQKTKEKKQEYQQTHKEQIAQRSKIHYDEHKEAMLEKAREYRKTHKEQIAKKDKIRNQSEDRKEQKKQKFECECGKIICKSHKARHEQTFKHQTYLATISN